MHMGRFFPSTVGCMFVCLALLIAGCGPVGGAPRAGRTGKIAFASNRDGNLEIYVMNADGSEQTRLTNNTTDEAYPAWSPDGTKIAFMTSHNGAPDIYVMNADGSDIKRLTDHPSQDVLSAWSPDGRQIAFASDRDGGNGAYVTYIMNADGSDQRAMPMQVPETLKPPLGLTGFAVWSPDRQRIAFEGAPGKTPTFT